MSADLSDAQIQASAPALALLPVANALLTRIDPAYQDIRNADSPIDWSVESSMDGD